MMVFLIIKRCESKKQRHNDGSSKALCLTLQCLVWTKESLFGYKNSPKVLEWKSKSIHWIKQHHEAFKAQRWNIMMRFIQSEPGEPGVYDQRSLKFSLQIGYDLGRSVAKEPSPIKGRDRLLSPVWDHRLPLAEPQSHPAKNNLNLNGLSHQGWPEGSVEPLPRADHILGLCTPRNSLSVNNNTWSIKFVNPIWSTEVCGSTSSKEGGEERLYGD